MKIAHAQLHMYTNIMYKFQSSKCKTRRKAPDNNNSVKFTSSRGDNSTTNDSMVMKIAQAQLHMYTNIMYKFQSSSCKTVGENLGTKLCPWTDRRMDSHGDSSTPPSTSLWGGIIILQADIMGIFDTLKIYTNSYVLLF